MHSNLYFRRKYISIILSLTGYFFINFKILQKTHLKLTKTDSVYLIFFVLKINPLRYLNYFFTKISLNNQKTQSIINHIMYKQVFIDLRLRKKKLK